MKNIKLEILVVILFVLSRLPDLGHDSFNTDVWKWKARSYDFGSGVFTMDFEKTIQKYHPGVTLMWIGTVGIKLFNFYSETISSSKYTANDISSIFILDAVQKILLVFVIGITLAFIFYVLRKLFGLKYASVAVFALSLEPFYLALTRVFHLEGLMSTFMLASAVWLYYYFDDKDKNSRLYISGLFTALAVLTKTSAVFMIPFSLLTLVLFYYINRDKVDKLNVSVVRTTGITFLKWLAAVILGFFLIWPANWVNPGLVITTLYRGVSVIGIERDHDQFYFNKFVTDPGVSYYFVVLALRCSVVLLAGFILQLVFINKDKKVRKFIYFMLIFTLFYFIQITIPSKKLDRYILPSLLSMSLISSVFYTKIIDLLDKKKILLTVTYVIAVITPFIYLHPDYFSYYNPALGGLSRGIYILEPKWLIGEREILDYFKIVQKNEGLIYSGNDVSFEEQLSDDTLDTTLTVGFQEKYYTQIYPFFREIGAWAVIQDLTPFAEKTTYFVYPIWNDQGINENRFQLRLIDSIKIRGVPVYNVYKRI